MLRSLALAVALFVASACTTSRAVVAWHDGWQAEQAGDPAKAAKRYEDATARNPKLFGAGLNRVRVLAQQPDRRKETEEALDKVLKAHGREPEVAAFAAQMALVDGDVKLARQRLDGSRPLAAGDGEQVRGVVAAATIALAAAEGKFGVAAAELAKVPTGTQVAPTLAATIAWNRSEPRAATAAIGAARGTQAAVLRALIARQEGRWTDVTAALGGIEGDDVNQLVRGLRAEALLRTDRPHDALGIAIEAARRDPADPWLTELWAVALLKSGQAAAARDLLVGLTARDPRWSPWHHLGLTYTITGDLPAAARSFAAAAARCPECAAPAKNRDALASVGFR
jgi:tetratricopeptide (TPR) repeat protein